MRKYRVQRQKWILVAFTLLYSCQAEETWSKPEQSLTNQDNGWIPVQGKCLTCRPNRDLDAQSTNEQISKVLSPPLPRQQNLPSAPPPQQPIQPQIQPLQFVNNKQPRILPFAPNFHQYNLPVAHDNKQYQIQPTKLFSQEQKQFYPFEGNHFPKQPYNLPQQQLIQAPNQQRFPGEPYPFTLPLKIEATTQKISYQPKIRFPDEPKPLNKIPPQTDEIQLLYVPVETLQRQRNVKNMKDLINQQQFQHTIPHGFVSPQFNLQYQPVPKPENQFYFPPNFSPPPNFFLNPLPAQKIPDNVFGNVSKNFLQPYFTINGLYSPVPQIQQIPQIQQVPQIQPVPTKQPDLQFYNILQPALLNPAPIKPEPSPLPQQINRQPNKYDFNNNFQNLQGGFVVSNGEPKVQPHVPSQTFETYTATTPEILKTTEFVTEKSTPQRLESSPNDYNQYATSSPQTSASQNQQYVQQTAQNQQLYSQADNQYLSQQNAPNPYATAQNQQFLQQNVIPKNITKSYTPPATTFDDPNYPVPHQPPLSFYMEKLHNTKINDVLYLLKDAKTIPVLDTVETEPPQVFVGPSELEPPKGYIKFELPYLSSLDYNRIERMIDRLPFFVAPLNFKPPPGYSKIPFPAPHIGSVVLSNSSVLQESLNKYDQKYKPSEQKFSTPVELSTITPQLTSQINSLIDSPPPSPETKYYEETTKKQIYKNTYRPVTSTEQPKRNYNRQRKPIYRGYPTTETPTTYESSTTEAAKTENKEEYVEFSAKGKFNIADSVPQNPTYQPVPQNPTYQPSQVYDSYQTQQAPENSYQPQPSLDSYQPQQVPSTYQPTQETNYTVYSTYQSPVAENQSNENLFTKKIASQNSVDFTGQNYPFYNFDLSSSQAPSEISSEQAQNVTQETQNFNFNNVKPLSQYNHFIKKEDSSPVNITETSTSSNSDSYQFWNQNQFYKSHPNTLEYFSSTPGNQILETTPSTTEPGTQQKFRYTTESSKLPEPSPEVQTEVTTSHRPRTKQRIPSRYQSKYTTEKHEEEVSHELDSVQQSTENNEASTRVEIKRRRRPVRPTIVTPASEVSSTTRNYRTRATRYPIASSTERYRPRRPTTTVESEWNSYVPSAPASNEIVPEKKPEEKDPKPDDSYWSEAVSIHQSQSYEVPAKPVKNFTDENPTDYIPWTDATSKNSFNDFSPYPTAENVPEKDKSENKTESVPVETSSYEKPSDVVSPTFGTVNYNSTVEQPDDKEIKKEKFLTKDDSQKKAYDPQDEKKVPGRRRGTWVRRIRVKRPQDVFETAESQNLGRITDNSVQLLDSKILSKTDENDSYKIKSSTVSDDIITTTEPLEIVKTTTDKDDYESLQSNFAQMLSDFLNSNDKSVKTVNIERTNLTSENNISYILGLENRDNSSSSYINFNTPTESINIVDELTTTYPNSESFEIQPTTEEASETVQPNKLLGTSTTTEISLETEICYRGKCVKTKKSKASDLLPVE